MVPGKHIVSTHLHELPGSQDIVAVPFNSPATVSGANELEEGCNINLSDDIFDVDLETATKKIESMCA